MSKNPKPLALNWIVLKIAQRCNLNCTYCYVYNRGDDSWKDRQPIISDDVALALAQRIAEHCDKYGLDRFVVEFHGGEPLLVGKRRLQRLLDILRDNCPSVTFRFLLQTNGLLLDEEWIQLFHDNSIRFGISLDGPPRIADKFRVFHDGQGSTRPLLDKIAQLRRDCPLFERQLGGYLCVVNPDIHGGELVRWFVEQDIAGFDFLLPDGNYDNLPHDWVGAQPYLRFFIEAFDEWYRMGEDAPVIRFFEIMMMGHMGVKPQLDALGGDLSNLCVVESNGAIGVSDVVRMCGGEFARDELSVFEHPLDIHAGYYDVKSIQTPNSKCLSCPQFDSCRGGYLPHRFDGATFDNPSIYCEALFGLSEHMLRALRRDLPGQFWKHEVITEAGRMAPAP